MFDSLVHSLWEKFRAMGDPASPEYVYGETKYIEMVGTELEGVFNTRKLDELGISLSADGSVREFSPSLFTGHRERKVGEVAFHNTINKIRSKFFESYPVAVNETCGLHIHLSFKDYHKAVFNLGDRKFLSFLQQGLRELVRYPAVNDIDTDHLLARLAGGNNFCGWDINILDRNKKDKLSFNSDQDYYRETREGTSLHMLRGKQLNALQKNGERYAMLNFCYNLHGTLEMRAYPMFHNAGVGYAALCWYVYLVESFMDLMSKYDDKPIYKFTLQGKHFLPSDKLTIPPAGTLPSQRPNRRGGTSNPEVRPIITQEESDEGLVDTLTYTPTTLIRRSPQRRLDNHVQDMENRIANTLINAVDSQSWDEFQFRTWTPTYLRPVATDQTEEED